MKSVKIKSFIIKLIVIAILILVFDLIGQVIAPIAQNQIAMMQMGSAIDSNMGIQLYYYLKDYSWVLIVLVTAMLFKREINYIFNKAKEIVKNEKH